MEIFDKFSEYKLMLNSLLKNTFENKLQFLEKRSQSHLSSISSTKEQTKNITSLAVKLHNQITSKLKKDKSIPKFKKIPISKNITSPKSSKKHGPGFKTPITKKNTGNNGLKTPGNNKTIDTRMKRNLENTQEKSSTIDVKSKSFANNKKYKRIMNKTFASNFKEKNDSNYLKRQSVASYKLREKNKLNKTFMTISNDNDMSKSQYAKTSKKLKNLNKTNDGNESVINKLETNKSLDRKKFKTIKNDSSSCVRIFNKIKKIKVDEKSERDEKKEKEKEKEKIKDIDGNKINDKEKNKILAMEDFLQKDEPLIRSDEPLLIAPITDSDLQHQVEILNNNNQIIEEIKNIKNNYFENLDKNIGDNILNNIFGFLCLNDLIKLRGTSKFFNKHILCYFTEKLNYTKIELENKKVNMIITDLSESKNFQNLELSNGTQKSIELLNQNVANKFFEESNPPMDDNVLFIYEIFFQLINNPIVRIKNNKNEFWDKCRLFFLNDGNTKIGDLLKEEIMGKNKIDTSEDNLYKIYKLSKNKLDIIVPSYINKICTHTSLITFFIRDILKYLGISLDEEDIKQNGYWTYTNIINSINKKIINLKNMGNKNV